MSRFTTTEAAERLGVPPTTLRQWVRTLPVPFELDSRGQRRLDDQALRVLETIKSLRADSAGYETIRRVIGPVPDAQPTPDDADPTADSFTTDAQPSLDREGFTRAIADAVEQAIEKQATMAEKLSRATYTIGQLEERVANLTAQLDEAKTQVALLSAPKKPWWRLW